MNEEEMIPTEIVTETEDTAATSADNMSDDNTPDTRSEELVRENASLRRRLFCLENNIPAELANDVMLLAAAEAERDDVSLETAAKSVWERLSRIGGSIAEGRKQGKKPITTGAAVKGSGSKGADPLRAAFGLKG